MINVDKETFCSTYKRNVNRDISTVWDIMQERIKELGLKESINGTSSESDKEIRIEHEGNNAQKVDAVSVPKRRIQKANNRPKHN